MNKFEAELLGPGRFPGQSAVILQGIPATTLDTDFWVEVPSRRFVQLTVLWLRGTMPVTTVAALADDINTEYKKAGRLRWQRMIVRFLPLESILKSKQAIRRLKDIAHIPLIRPVLRLREGVIKCG